jgi:DNA-binding protein HU-beta
MIKEDILRKISQTTEIEKATVSQVIESFMESVKAANIAGETVYLRGFGTFGIKHRAEKKGRNISKNTIMVLPAHNIPHFKPSREFKNRVKAK